MPQDPPMSELQALVTLYAKGEHKGLLTQCEALIAQFPLSSTLLTIRGAAYSGLQEYDLALESYDRALELTPLDASIYFSQGDSLYDKGEFKASIERYNEALRIDPSFAEAYCNRGLAQQALEEWEAAANSFLKAISLVPDFVEAYSNLGNALRGKGDLKGAIDACNRALSLNPNHAVACFNRGCAEQDQGMFEEAVASYQRALSIESRFVEAHYNLGNAYRDLNESDRAIASYEEALKLQAGLVEAWLNRGLAYQSKGDLEIAAASYASALKIQPDYAEALSNLGIVLLEQGDLENATRHVRRALSLRPDYADAQVSLGMILHAKGELEAALASYNSALGIEPDHVDAHYNAGVTQQDRGCWEEAIGHYTRALNKNPEHKDAASNIAKLFFQNKQYHEAGELFAQSETADSQTYLLKCLYEQLICESEGQETAGGEQIACDRFFEQLDRVVKLYRPNAVMGSYISRANARFGSTVLNPYCANPLDYVSHISLAERNDFARVFVEPALAILRGDAVEEKQQSLLRNGSQTAGEFFRQAGVLGEEMLQLIREELENYRARFANSEEGLIALWPENYTVSGWLVSMSDGGELAAHMHDTGWLTGSIYINVPNKKGTDGGNLVVSQEDVFDHSVMTNNRMSIDVKTGSFCLFPSSLLHYTLPVVSNEKRIVLAFDIIPK